MHAVCAENGTERAQKGHRKGTEKGTKWAQKMWGKERMERRKEEMEYEGREVEDYGGRVTMEEDKPNSS